ncbi:MAG: cellulase family glycosylhydrolase [Treponema sp.]|nr:cellulase family glycosylhydrolase [Treponema sp.]
MKQFSGYMHGVNLGGWLSQCNYKKEHLDSFILEDDIKTIASWNLDHVRLPVDYNLFQAEDGSLIESGFAYVQNCINWCRKYNLNMILDLHKTAGFSFDKKEKEIGLFDDPELQNKYYSLWEEFARRYSKYENMMCFELLNEVTDQSYSKKWNAIAKSCIEHIRKIAPTIKILVGSYWNNSISSVKDLDPPYDENIVYNFHCYEPLVFTHQGAGWVSPNMDRDFRFAFDSTYAEYTEATKKKIAEMNVTFGSFPQNATPDAVYFETLFAEALKIAEERNVLLYCGEYGVIEKATPEDTVKWYKIITSVFNKYGIGRAAWTYKRMDFGLSDSRLDACRQELLKVL